MITNQCLPVQILIDHLITIDFIGFLAKWSRWSIRGQELLSNWSIRVVNISRARTAGRAREIIDHTILTLACQDLLTSCVEARKEHEY